MFELNHYKIRSSNCAHTRDKLEGGLEVEGHHSASSLAYYVLLSSLLAIVI